MIQVDRAQPGDFLAIAALDRVAWRGGRNCEFIPDGEHVWRIWCEHALVFVGRDDAGQVVAAILAFPCLDGRYCIHKVMVDASCRGQGVGSLLFDAMLAALDERGAAAFLTVDPANGPAVKLYEKWGFTERQFVSGFYRPAEDRWVLTRPKRNP